jgi:hypothetical protein
VSRRFARFARPPRTESSAELRRRCKHRVAREIERFMAQIIGGIIRRRKSLYSACASHGGQMRRRPWPMPVAGMQKLWSTQPYESSTCGGGCFLSRSMWEPPWAGENRTPSAGRRDPPGSIASFIEILAHSRRSVC